MNNFDYKNPKNIYALAMSLLILGAVYWFYDSIWLPFEAEEIRLKTEIADLEKQKDLINKWRKDLKALQDNLKNADEEFERLKEMFPEQEQVPLRLADLYAVVRSSGVEISRFSPSGATAQEHYIENKYSLAINSGYHMLGYLFAEIANFKYPTAINDLRLIRFGGIKQELEKSEMHGWTPITLTVTFNLTTYTSKFTAASQAAPQ
jgi:type IV pilus assembly protein PilO